MSNSGFRIENDILKGNDVPYRRVYTGLGEFVLSLLQAKPDFVGQVDTVTEETYTYKKMQDRSVRCAVWMKAQGLVSGDVVSICSYNQMDVSMPCFAAMYLGMIASPLDSGLSKREFQHMLSVSEPKVAFVAKELANTVADAARDAKLDVKIVVFGKVDGFLDFESVIAEPNLSDVTSFELTTIDDPELTALILFTSGSSGTPKGVALGHKAVLRTLQLWEGLVDMKITWAIFTSLAWFTGTLYLFSSLLLGIPRLIVPSFDEYSACALIEKYKVNWIFLAPNMVVRLLKSDAPKKYDISGVRQILCGGSSLSYGIQEAFAEIVPNARIMTGYGSTEVGGMFSKQVKTSKPGSTGVIQTNCQLKVVDPDTGRIMGPNQQGELLLKTKAMMNCYYRDPQATAQAIDAEGWMHSGDLGYYDEDGEIFIVDRLKELIKYRGYHISPTDIENVILTHPGVEDVAVVGLPHPQDDEHPVAFVVRKTITDTVDKRVTEQEIVDLVAAELSDSKRLRGGVKFVERIPRTPSDKVQRKALRDLALSMTHDSTGHTYSVIEMICCCSTAHPQKYFDDERKHIKS